MELIFTVLLIVCGVQCFFGYRIFRFLTAVIGFVVGAAIGAGLGLISAGQAGALAFGLILGILGGFLAFTLYKVGVFIICFGAGAVLGGVLGLMAGDQSMMIAFAGIAGLLLGVLGVILVKPLIILCTSAGGGMGAGMALGMLMQQLPMGMVLGVVLAVAGILVQFKLDQKAPKKAEEGGAVPESERKGIQLPGLPKADVAGAGGAAGEGLKSAFASLKSGAAGLGQKVGAGAQSVVGSQAVRQLRGTIDNTKTTHPLSGWNELAREENPLWAKGFPIVVQEARVVASPSEDGVRLALGFQNLSGQDILGVFFAVTCADLLKQKLEGIEKLAIQDFRLAPGGLWFSEQPFPLPDKDTRRVGLTVKNVVFADGSIWSNETGVPLEPMASQPALELSPELSQELFRACRAHISGHDPERIFRYQPQKEADCWWCACGQLNTGGRCLACGMEKEALFDLIRPERLSQIREARLEEQRRLEEERRQKIAEQTEAAKQKAAEMSAKTAATLKKGLDKGTELGKQTGDALNKGLNKGAELGKQTGDKIKAFWAEKIEPNKRTIAIVACVFVAVLAVLLGTLFGLKAYRASQEEKALLAAQQEAEERRQKAEEERRAAQELAEWEAQFLFPYSDQEPIDESALSVLSDSELNLAKYEILARHGRVFSTAEYAQYFEGKPWYTPSSSFDENAAGALSDVERANMELIDRVILKRRSAALANTYLKILDGGVGAYTAGNTIKAVDGIYWSGLEYNSERERYDVSLYWNTGTGYAMSTCIAGTILAAKVLDMNKDSVPELLILTVANQINSDRTLEVQLWEPGLDQNAVLTQTFDITPLLAQGDPPYCRISFVPGEEQDCLHASYNGFDFFYTAGQSKSLIDFERVWDPFAPITYEEGPECFVNEVKVTEEEYRRTLEQWTEGESFWMGNMAHIEVPYEVWEAGNFQSTPGTIVLDMQAELEAAREYLTQLANG